MGYTYSPLVETWALYIVGSILIFLRCLCRWKMVGFRGFQPDDYLIFLSWVRWLIDFLLIPLLTYLYWRRHVHGLIFSFSSNYS